MSRCGECSWCCFFTAVPELAKPNNQWCCFCKPGEGCGSYNLRPSSCSEYICLYFANYWLPEDYRPDKCGVMFEKLYDSKVFLALVDPKRPNSWLTGLGRKVIAKLRDGGFSVVVCAKRGNPFHFILADGDTKDNIIHSIRHAIQASNAKVEETRGSSVVHFGS
jgi:hypothetical protein